MKAPAGEGLRRIAGEILGEKAAALGRSGERLEGALAAAAALADRLRTASDPRDVDRLSTEYRLALRRARDARLALIIQREALGLRRHAVVDERFPEPPARPTG